MHQTRPYEHGYNWGNGMTEKASISSSEVNKRLVEAGVMLSFNETRTAYEVARDFGLLHLSEICIEGATDEQTEV